MKIYDEYFDGCDIFDCIVGKNMGGLLARESGVPLSEVVKSKLVDLGLSRNSFGSDNGYADLENFPDMHGCLITHPDPAFILVSSNRQVFKRGYEGDNEVDKLEEDICDDSFIVTNVRAINGRAYAVTIGREVFRRDDVNVWVNIGSDMSDNVHLREEVYETGGFNDIDGFSEQDLYAAGENGDCWHYDGEKWERIDLPVNSTLETVCCAEDGYVYIGGMYETILKGRYDKWEILRQEKSESSVWKIVSFKSKIYISMYHGLFELKDKALKEVHYGGLSVSDYGLLGTDTHKTKLVAGGSLAVYVFDGDEWKELINILS